ncbi:DprA-like winged helix domain-containing protein, partial [Geminicoccus harenae]
RERIASPPPRRTERAQLPLPAQPSYLPASGSPAPGGLVAQVLACLGAEPLAVDDLVRQCQATTAQIHETLLELELEGRLERHGGNRVSLLFA